eukprot:TRINITY_DN59086_c0_g1_i1.p1 TRINITY_DN59086_c0_g1~~TRINITY_DN59086_c0_g1_i1.p1  ORF type:complete len:443 (+),score=80.00 TRINITY_DN59086_c0_g1_i1:139-1467(+)
MGTGHITLLRYTASQIAVAAVICLLLQVPAVGARQSAARTSQARLETPSQQSSSSGSVVGRSPGVPQSKATAAVTAAAAQHSPGHPTPKLIYAASTPLFQPFTARRSGAAGATTRTAPAAVRPSPNISAVPAAAVALAVKSEDEHKRSSSSLMPAKVSAHSRIEPAPFETQDTLAKLRPAAEGNISSVEPSASRAHRRGSLATSLWPLPDGTNGAERMLALSHDCSGHYWAAAMEFLSHAQLCLVGLVASVGAFTLYARTRPPADVQRLLGEVERLCSSAEAAGKLASRPELEEVAAASASAGSGNSGAEAAAAGSGDKASWQIAVGLPASASRGRSWGRQLAAALESEVTWWPSEAAVPPSCHSGMAAAPAAGRLQILKIDAIEVRGREVRLLALPSKAPLVIKFFGREAPITARAWASTLGAAQQKLRELQNLLRTQKKC